jgi:alanyl-tRNA synthetase
MLVQRNPAMLQELLAEMNRTNPQLTQLINANQAEFLALINEPVPADAQFDFGDFGGGDEDMAMAGGTNPSGLDAALASVQAWVTERL